MFCPDCRATVVGVEIIRSKTKDIISECKSGYDFFVKNGTLPRLVYNSTIENCKKILSFKKEIAKKNKSLLAEEIENNNKRQEEIKRNEQIIREASKIALYYPNGYRYYKNVCHFENYTQHDFSLGNFLSLAVSIRVLAKKDDTIRKEREFQEEERKRKEEQRIHLLSELNRLGITDENKQKMFIEHPERIKSEYWINYAKRTTSNNRTGNTQSGCMLIFMFLLSSALSLATIVKLLIF